jgi:hypothetical protein
MGGPGLHENQEMRAIGISLGAHGSKPQFFCKKSPILAGADTGISRLVLVGTRAGRRASECTTGKNGVGCIGFKKQRSKKVMVYSS